MKKININHIPITKLINTSLINLPTPSSINFIWNWGFSIRIILGIQLIRGIILTSHYIPSIDLAFDSIISISRNINIGYLLRFIHINMASLFFLTIFIHIRRGMLFSSFKLESTWISGVSIILVLIATAFLGYVLPWGQISFWGATVITNLLSEIPYIGKNVVEWLWGGYSIRIPTLNRFFILHFLLPFILTILILIHLLNLHQSGSSNPLRVNSNYDKTPFHPFFSRKDLISIFIILLIFLNLTLLYPFILLDPENYNPANPLNTPPHIQPEWYFLFAYAILRSIPNKFGGVIALALSIISLRFLPLFKIFNSSKKLSPLIKTPFWLFSSSFLTLTWIGASPVEPPYEIIGKIFSFLYFFFLFI